jgi:hypothetical protein
MANYDVLGNIVVWKFKRGVSMKEKKKIKGLEREAVEI